jgi:Papain-like cysteine protease AvrRpt2
MLLKRYLFRLLRGAGLALLLPVASQASERCTIPDAAGIQRCRAELSATQIQAMAATQEKSQWCWAASIAMLFARYGHALSQEHIVRQYFGHVADRPVAAEAITQLLTRPWKDGEGRSFEASASVSLAQREPKSAYDAMVNELASQRPLLIGVAGHAMVLVGIDFDRLPDGGGVRITGGKVIDPMPGRGVRRLFGYEARPTYLASVNVSDAAVSEN